MHELLERRAPGVGGWSTRDTGRRGRGLDLDVTFAQGAELLRTHAGDLLTGRNLELLDDIIEKRPQIGVPGLDFPTNEPWFTSAEGVLFTTDSEMPRDMAEYLERSRSPDPTTRAVAALKIPIASRGTRDQALLAAGHDRLHELLKDPVDDVHRAAASALGEWPDADALDEILALLESDPGDRVSPIAAAAAFIALDLRKADKQRVVEALRAYATRHAIAAEQADALIWRLGDGKSRGYPRVIRLWRGPDRRDDA